MIRLNDGKPWFRRWMWIGARPITWEGYVIAVASFAVCFSFAWLALRPDNETWQVWIFGALFLSAGAAANIVILLKTEDDF